MKKYNKKKIERPIHIDQWIEIMRKDGETVAVFYPSNREMEKLRLELDPPPSLIYRRLNFINGVPFEYNWTLPNEDLRQYGGHFLQRVKAEEWPWLMAEEIKFNNKLVKCAPTPQPRPEAYGPCPCFRCTAKREANPDL